MNTLIGSLSDLVGVGRGTVKLLSWHIQVATEEKHKNSNRVDGNLAEI